MFRLAAEMSDLAAATTPQKIALVLNWSAIYWALGLTICWDLVELWVRGLHFKFLRTQAFWIYLLCHGVLSLLATIALGNTFEAAWVIGLLAAVSNEMVLSNANITFGTANLLPLLELFKKLRAVIQQRTDDIAKASTRELIETLSKLPLATLEAKLITLSVQNGKLPQQINQELAELKMACAGNDKLLATKLANDFIQQDPEGARRAASVTT